VRLLCVAQLHQVETALQRGPERGKLRRRIQQREEDRGGAGCGPLDPLAGAARDECLPVQVVTEAAQAQRAAQEQLAA
jgi:hypothetical protein